MERKDLILLAATQVTTKPLTPQQLQYTTFLMGKARLKQLPENFYTFKAFHHGPHNAEDINQDIEILADQGLIFKVRHPQGWDNVAPSPEGMERAKTLAAQLPPPVAEYITSLVQWAQSNTFTQNLYAICKAFPDFAVNSVLSDHTPATQNAWESEALT